MEKQSDEIRTLTTDVKNKNTEVSIYLAFFCYVCKYDPFLCFHVGLLSLQWKC